MLTTAFSKVSDIENDSLRKRFLDEMRSRHSESPFARLLEVFGTKPKYLSLKFFVMSGRPDVFIVMINGKNDFQLIDLAKTYAFPRGCVVVWEVEVSMRFLGFFPKFNNDTGVRSSFDKDFDMGDFEPDSMTLGLKYSGFLGQIVCFELSDGSIHFSVCSKKSADSESPFVQMAVEIISDYMTPELAKKLSNECLYIGAEILHPGDDHHGYVVSKRGLAVTCIGAGFTSSASDGDRKELMRYFSEEATLEFCVRHDLPFAEQYKIELSESSCVKLSYVLEKLMEKRDVMTYSLFLKALAEIEKEFPVKVTKITGGLDHSVAVGDVLEGLVVKLRNRNGRTSIIKIKFPFYTICTMFARALVEGEQVTTAGYVDRWVTRKYPGYFTAVCNEAGKYIEEKRIGCLNKGEKPLHISAVADAISKVGLHSEFCSDSPRAKPSDRKVFPVVIVLGGVGAGKTTIAAQIEGVLRAMGRKAKHCDFDRVLVWDGKNVTNLLGALRNGMSMAEIYTSIREGFMPIISCGGGQLLDQKSVECVLEPRLKAVFPSLDFHFTIIYCTGKVVEVRTLGKGEDIGPLLDVDVSHIDNLVRKRVENGEWPEQQAMKLTDLIPRIMKVSSENGPKAHTIVTTLDNADVVLVPKVDPSTCLVQANAIFTELERLSSPLIQPLSFSKVAMVCYRRYLILKYAGDKFCHVTLFYGNEPAAIESMGAQPMPSGTTIEGSLVTVHVKPPPSDADSKKKKPVSGRDLSVIDLSGVEALKGATSSEIPHATVFMSSFANKDSPLLIANKDDVSKISFTEKSNGTVFTGASIEKQPIKLVVVGSAFLGKYE